MAPSNVPTFSQAMQVLKLLHDRRPTEQELQRLFGRWDLINQMLKAEGLGTVDREEFEEALGGALVHGKYSRVLRQANWLRRLADRGLGISTRGLDEICELAAGFDWEAHPECSLTIYWTLHTLEATWGAKERVLRWRYRDISVIPIYIGGIRVSPQGREFRPNVVELVIIEPEANYVPGEAPNIDDVTGGNLAGLELFDQADQHPEALRDPDAPAWTVGGLELPQTFDHPPRYPWITWGSLLLPGRDALRIGDTTGRKHFKSSIPTCRPVAA